VPQVYVIGDAAIAGAMPKSGFSANSQAKICAAAVHADLRGRALGAPSYANTCYSLLAPEYGISISAVYRVADGAIAAVPDAGGVSPMDADVEFRRQEAEYAHGWYAAITADTWGPRA
jgi:sulfide dehydrogenase [flavocytochrome c] flavoprotein subunit